MKSLIRRLSPRTRCDRYRAGNNERSQKRPESGLQENACHDFPLVYGENLTSRSSALQTANHHANHQARGASVLTNQADTELTALDTALSQALHRSRSDSLRNRHIRKMVVNLDFPDIRALQPPGLAGQMTLADDLTLTVVTDGQLPFGDEVPVEAVRRFQVVAVGDGHLPRGFAERHPAEAGPHRR